MALLNALEFYCPSVARRRESIAYYIVTPPVELDPGSHDLVRWPTLLSTALYTSAACVQYTGPRVQRSSAYGFSMTTGETVSLSSFDQRTDNICVSSCEQSEHACRRSSLVNRLILIRSLWCSSDNAVAYGLKLSTQLKLNWNKTEQKPVSKLLWNCFVSVSFQLCGECNIVFGRITVHRPLRRKTLTRISLYMRCG